MWYVNAYTEEILPWMEDYSPSIQHSQYGPYVRLETDDRGTVTKLLHSAKIRYDVYEKKWSRKSDYRKRFIENNPPPYRCRYCNKKLTKEQMQVDHIIPINKSRKSILARNLLYLKGISDVNDLKNLAPSCPKCNKKKGDHIWLIRSTFGKYRFFWPIYRVLQVLVIIALVLFLWKICINSFNIF